MNRFLVAALSITLIGCNASSPVKDDLGYQGYSSKGVAVEELLSKLKANPDAKFRIEGGWHIVELKSEQALYTFTPQNHQAHPSYVKREVVEKDGALYIETTAECGAENIVCDQLVRDFIKLNDGVIEYIGEH
jgi:hypothetical protein